METAAMDQIVDEGVEALKASADHLLEVVKEKPVIVLTGRHLGDHVRDLLQAAIGKPRIPKN